MKKEKKASRIKTGWYPEVPDKIYHWGNPYKDFLNNSGIKEFAKSPAHLKASRAAGEGKKTPALLQGTVFHYESLGVPYGCLDFKPDQIEIACSMADKLEEHSIANNILKQADKEVSGFFKDPDFQFWCKIRLDLKLSELGVIADLKSTADASAFKFRKDSFWFRYHWQAFWYLRGANAIEPGKYHSFIIVAQEKKEPYGIGVYKIGDELLSQAEKDIMPLLERYAKCVKSDTWEAYPEEIIEL